MTLGFTDTGLYVNSASGSSRDALDAAGIGVDAAGRVPLSAIVQEAQAQGVNVTVETIAGTLVAVVAIRREVERLADCGKRQANRIMRQRSAIESAPLQVAGQPAYTVEQLAVMVAEHDAQARRNKVRRPVRADATDDYLEGTPAADDKC